MCFDWKVNRNPTQINELTNYSATKCSMLLQNEMQFELDYHILQFF